MTPALDAAPAASDDRPQTTRAVPLVLFALVAGSIGTMSIGNAFELSTAWVPLVFLVASLAAAGLFIRARVPLPVLRRGEHAAALGLATILALPRVPYLFEPLVGAAFDAACWDDWWHVQELASIVHSPSFPLRSTFVPDALFSFYYAAWMPGAAAFLASVLVTAKQALFVDIALLQIMAAYAVVYAGHVLCGSDVRRRHVLVGAVVFFGGFDAVYGVATMATNWLRGTSHAIPHAEWWPTAVGFELQHSNIVTLALWVPHHLAAAVAVGFVLMLLSRPLTPMRGAVAGVAFTYAAFASAFVWLGALPFVAWVVLRHRPALTGLGVCAVVSAALALPNAWMYLRSDAPGIEWFGVVQDYWYERGFWWSLPAFVGVLAVEFLPLLVALRIGRREHAEHRVPLLLAAAFLLSTYVVAYHGANNYATRGAAVPSLVLVYCAVPGLSTLATTRTWRTWVLVPFFLGGLWELASFSNAARHAYMHVTPFHRAVLASNLRHGEAPSAELQEAADEVPEGWYLIENHRQTAKPRLRESDQELFTRDQRLRVSLR